MIIGDVMLSGIAEPASVYIDKSGRIAAAAEDAPGVHLRFGDAIAFPGLINSHDHLDFNTFPRLGNRKYDNYVAWGDDIHATDGTLIRDVLRIPQALRVQWSLYKNLLNGVTTVVQHGPHFSTEPAPINVFEDCVAIHSLRLEKRWKLRLNKPRRGEKPVVVHIGEGTDRDAHAEIDELIRWNLLRRKLVGVHGIAMTPAQARHFHALVWCPDSNHFLYGKTADIRALQAHVPVVFGTDSMLTSEWNMWNQIRLGQQQAAPSELYDMLTRRPAAVWGLQQRGRLNPAAEADLVIARRKAEQFAHAFIALEPADLLMILAGGQIRLVDASLVQQLDATRFDPGQYRPVRIGGITKYVYGDLPGLVRQIRTFDPSFGAAMPEIDFMI